MVCKKQLLEWYNEVYILGTYRIINTQIQSPLCHRFLDAFAVGCVTSWFGATIAVIE